MILKVGHKIYSIEELSPMEDLGECFTDECVIHIRAGLPDQTALPTLFHEMLHAVWDYVGLPTENEEQIINALDDTLYTACSENAPLLFPHDIICMACANKLLHS
jgi:hypothetical protein